MSEDKAEMSLLPLLSSVVLPTTPACLSLIKVTITQTQHPCVTFNVLLVYLICSKQSQRQANRPGVELQGLLETSVSALTTVSMAWSNDCIDQISDD